MEKTKHEHTIWIEGFYKGLVTGWLIAAIIALVFNYPNLLKLIVNP